MPDYGDISRNKKSKQPSEVEKRAIQTRHVGTRAGRSKASRLETLSTLKLHNLARMRSNFGDGHRQISVGLYINPTGSSAKDLPRDARVSNKSPCDEVAKSNVLSIRVNIDSFLFDKHYGV